MCGMTGRRAEPAAGRQAVSSMSQAQEQAGHRAAVGGRSQAANTTVMETLSCWLPGEIGTDPFAAAPLSAPLNTG